MQNHMTQNVFWVRNTCCQQGALKVHNVSIFQAPLFLSHMCFFTCVCKGVSVQARAQQHTPVLDYDALANKISQARKKNVIFWLFVE